MKLSLYANHEIQKIDTGVTGRTISISHNDAIYAIYVASYIES
jgi:hypothetical protein